MKNKDNNFGIFLMTAVLLFVVPYFVLPNLFTDIKNLEYETKIIKSTRILKEKNNSRSLPGKYITSLIIKMTDGSEIQSSEEYDKYWPQIQKKDNIGKQIKYYHSVNGSKEHNPLQIEINNKIVYKKNENLKYVIVLIVLMFVFTSISVIKLVNMIKAKTDIQNP